MIVVMACGAGFGLGLLAVVYGLYPPPPRLADALAALHRPPPPAPVIDADTGGWAERLGRPFAGVLAGLGLPTASVRRDLAVLARPADRHLAEKVTAALTGLLLAPAVTFLLALTGVQLPLVVPVWAALLAGGLGFVAPDLGAKADAARRRTDFRHALAAFLDLVVISLAGGSGVDGALADASRVGHGWAFTQLRRALEVAHLTRTPPWTSLGQLGDELGITELRELAASVALAGTEGAKVRASLAAKAQALRTHELSDAETAAHAATEQMALPVVVLFAGFLLFIGYPAMAHVLTGL